MATVTVGLVPKSTGNPYFQECQRGAEEAASELGFTRVIWKTRDLGYLVALSAHALAGGSLEPGAVSFRAGRLGSIVVIKDAIRLGRCHIVSRGNLADFD